MKLKYFKDGSMEVEDLKGLGVQILKLRKKEKGKVKLR